MLATTDDERRSGESSNIEDSSKRRGRPKSPETSRIHISIPDELAERLVEIQKLSYAGSLTEVIKNALIVYANLLEEHKEKNEFYVKDNKTGILKQYILFL